jgi:Fe-S-cluster containining protein
MKDKSRFYNEGLRFECTCCGNCCRLPNGKVYLNQKKVQEICDFLNLFPEDFTKSYCVTESNRLHLSDGFDNGCCFLKDNQCRVYPVRPLQCRTFPFWPENLKSQYRWKQLSAGCPGIGKGDLHSAEWIQQIVRLQKKADG